MDLKIDSSSIVGTYVLDNGTRGTLNGIMDGDTFHASFFKGNTTQKWQIRANWKHIGNFIEISGPAVLLKAKEQRWEQVGQNELYFFASIRLGQPLAVR